MRKRLNFNKEPVQQVLYPSNELIKNILRGIPYQYYALYLNLSNDIFYDTEQYEPGQGLNILDYKLMEQQLFTNYPSLWLDEYFYQEMMNYDPVLKHGCYTLCPYTWGKSRLNISNLNNQPLMRIIRKSSNYGIENGLSVPIGIGAHTYALFTLTFENMDQFDINMLYQVAALMQNLGIYVVSYERPTLLKPLNMRRQTIILKSFQFLQQHATYIERCFQERNAKHSKIF